MSNDAIRDEIERLEAQLFSQLRSTRAEGTTLSESNISQAIRDIAGSLNNENMATTTATTSMINEMYNSTISEHDSSSLHSYTNLTPAQIWLLQQVQQNAGAKLLGSEFRIISTERGSPTKRIWLGNLVNIMNPGSSIRDIGFVIHLSDDTVYNARIYQVEPTKTVKPKKPTKKELEAIAKATQERVITEQLAIYNRQINRKFQDDKENLASYERDLRSYKNRVNEIEAIIKSTEARIASSEESNLGTQGFYDMLAEIKRHAKVEDAYITTAGRIVVFTKPLYGMDENDKENKDLFIGRIVISCNITGDDIRAFNLDQAFLIDGRHKTPVGPYGHPNISSSSQICLGSNEGEVRNMARDGQLYQLFDFLIVFFSVWPHDEDANPFCSFESWMQWKEKIKLTHPRLNNNFTFTIGTTPLFKSKAYDKEMARLAVEKAELEAGKNTTKSSNYIELTDPSGNTIRVPRLDLGDMF